ncbi:hypothetical protein DSM104299_05498 [Baekduia alba]|nr:hypothetical protein DSM104299_05498 [Baekduia alba]
MADKTGLLGADGARHHADRWLAAWNAHDLDAIMAG